MNGSRGNRFAELRANTLIWVPLVSLIVVVAWIAALRDRRKDEADR